MNETKITAATENARFTADDEQMIAVEQYYQEFESEFARDIASIKQDYPGYHDYQMDIDELGHDPYVLVAMCSAVKSDFRLNDPEIQKLLTELKRPRRQYTLTIDKGIADEFTAQFDGMDANVIDPKYVDLHVKFKNYDLYCVVDSVLNHDQLAAYAGYIRSHGMRPDLFPADKYTQVPQIPPARDFTPSPVYLEKYPLFKRELEIAEPLVGYPYVWGGSDVETSFDCSGFICYVMDNLGLKYRNAIRGKERRLAVAGSTVDGVFYDGIYDKCATIPDGEQQPGDLVFFGGTFDASYRSHNLTHVGIYCGDETFLACNAPCGIRYVSFNDKSGKLIPWRQLLAGYGRLPEVS